VTPAFRIDLEMVGSAETREGVIWALEGSQDLNVNLVRFGTGGGVGEHVNDEVDVVFVGVSGSGFVEVDGKDHALGPKEMILVPRGARRSTQGTSDDFAYLTVHRRRGPIQIGS
jgi:quercetin dioxygenase-like cupin family protein